MLRREPMIESKVYSAARAALEDERKRNESAVSTIRREAAQHTAKLLSTYGPFDPPTSIVCAKCNTYGWPCARLREYDNLIAILTGTERGNFPTLRVVAEQGEDT